MGESGLPCDSPILRQMLDEHLLLQAWARVRDNEGSAGADGQSLRQFSSQLLGALQVLKTEVLSGAYRPQPLRLVEIPKRSGGTRVLAIPSVRDRVLQTAMAMVIGPHLDASFDAASFGYRPGRSVAQAVAQLASWRDQGLQAVVDADIESFFDRINHRLLMQLLEARLRDRGALGMVALWLAAVLKVPGEQPRLLTCGVPQGSPLSPLLANLYLDRFDVAMRLARLNLVRYADDFVVLCNNAEQARLALGLATQALGELRLPAMERPLSAALTIHSLPEL
jgi:CRISPR-associated protein Cas1